MIKNVRIGIPQLNFTVGDIDGNCARIEEHIQKAKKLGVDILTFPELAVSGYPPEDLLLKEKFVNDNVEALKKLSRSVNDFVVVVGFVDKHLACIYNAAAVLYKGEVKGIYRKMLLPNYGVFDEKRYFAGGTEPLIFRCGDLVFGVNICEDIWHKNGPSEAQVRDGATLIININASPYHAGKTKEREELVRAKAKNSRAVFVYANLVGGQDELVFDGQSMIVDSNGKISYRAEAFKEDFLIADVDIPRSAPKEGAAMITVSDKTPSRTKPATGTRREIKPLESVAEIYEALILGLKDYVAKNGFKKVLIGLSGGVDSALVAILAKDALGSENVITVFMPTRYSSERSEADARKVASNLNIKFMDISIDHIFKIYLLTLEPHFAGLGKDITEENIQARIRGNILMALSNKFGWLVLATGNKSEMSTGYATLYGDMAGGFAVIKDVPKTLVYKLVKHRNSLAPEIPASVIAREPTAELRPDQKDRDTLPPYETLDAILKAYIEDDRDTSDIASLGFDRDLVMRVTQMVDRSEYKRRQAPPGIKITPKSFGKDRRMPITNKYR